MLGAFHMLSPSVLLTLLLPQFYRYGNIWLKIRFAQDRSLPHMPQVWGCHFLQGEWKDNSAFLQGRLVN